MLKKFLKTTWNAGCIIRDLWHHYRNYAYVAGKWSMHIQTECIIYGCTVMYNTPARYVLCGWLFWSTCLTFADYEGVENELWGIIKSWSSVQTIHSGGAALWFHQTVCNEATAEEVSWYSEGCVKLPGIKQAICYLSPEWAYWRKKNWAKFVPCEMKLPCWWTVTSFISKERLHQNTRRLRICL